MPYYYHFDIYYIIFVLPAIFLALIAQVLVKSRLNKYSKINNFKGITGQQAALQMLYDFGINNVSVIQSGTDFSDRYNPASNTIYLSDKVFLGRSIVSVCVACHEAGHAVQYALGYSPIKLKTALMPIAKIGTFILSSRLPGT